MDAQLRNDGLYFLKRNPIFGPMGEQVLLELVSKMKLTTLAKGLPLLREGDPTDALHLIKSGRARIVSKNEQGGEKTIAFLARGEAIGELSLLTGEPHVFGIVADTACEFLVLSKTDFDIILESHPVVGIHLSRALSRRLAVSFQPPHDTLKPHQLIAVLPALPHEAELLCVINLAIALVEQTRRKVVLLDLSPRSGDMARALGLNPPLSGESMFRDGDLTDVSNLRRLITVHASGLEILSLHPRVLRDEWLSAVPALLGLLKDSFDFTLIVAPAERDPLVQAVHRDCDRALFITWDKRTDLASQGRAALSENIDNGAPAPAVVHLQDPSHHSTERADFRVPWSESLHEPFRATGSPYLVSDGAGAAIGALGRLARALGKLRVGLAMGSGAAYGYSLIGMLKVFEREGIPIDMVSGTSMGALLGAFYCASLSPDRIQEIAKTITRRWLMKNIFGDVTFPHSGLLSGRTLSAFLRDVLGNLTFDQLLIPFAAVATDIRTGHEVVLKEGNVADAVRASTSLPMIFSPFRYKDAFLVDGGLVNPVPTSTVANMGADILISVNLTAKPSVRRGINRRLFPLGPQTPGLLEVFFKMIYTMQYEIAQSRTEISHVVIAPDMRDFLWTDLHRSEEIIKIGEAAAEEVVSKLKNLMPFFSDYCRVPIGVSLRAY
jgi:NTE family protein